MFYGDEATNDQKNMIDCFYFVQSLSLGGDMKGDGYQNGGCIVVGAGGNPLMYSFRLIIVFLISSM